MSTPDGLPFINMYYVSYMILNVFSLYYILYFLNTLRFVLFCETTKSTGEHARWASVY